jgi:hypothetical protein
VSEPMSDSYLASLDKMHAEDDEDFAGYLADSYPSLRERLRRAEALLARTLDAICTTFEGDAVTILDQVHAVMRPLGDAIIAHKKKQEP